MQHLIPVNSEDAATHRRVCILLKDAEVEGNEPGSVRLRHPALGFVHEFDEHDCARIDLTDLNVELYRGSPAGWPPQAGDVWTDGEGETWFFYQDPGPAGALQARNSKGNYYSDLDGIIEYFERRSQQPMTLIMRGGKSVIC